MASPVEFYKACIKQLLGECQEPKAKALGLVKG